MTEAAFQALVLLAIVLAVVAAVVGAKVWRLTRHADRLRAAGPVRNDLLRAGDPDDADSRRNGPVSFVAPGDNGGLGGLG